MWYTPRLQREFAPSRLQIWFFKLKWDVWIFDWGKEWTSCRDVLIGSPQVYTTSSFIVSPIDFVLQLSCYWQGTCGYSHPFLLAEVNPPFLAQKCLKMANASRRCFPLFFEKYKCCHKLQFLACFLTKIRACLFRLQGHQWWMSCSKRSTDPKNQNLSWFYLALEGQLLFTRSRLQ
jgi:hypothetical protein